MLTLYCYPKQILVYPLVDRRTTNASFTEYIDGPVLDSKLIDWQV